MPADGSLAAHSVAREIGTFRLSRPLNEIGTFVPTEVNQSAIVEALGSDLNVTAAYVIAPSAPSWVVASASFFAFCGAARRFRKFASPSSVAAPRNAA